MFVFVLPEFLRIPCSILSYLLIGSTKKTRKPSTPGMEDLSDQPNPSERFDLVQRAARSVKWTTLGSLLPRFVTPISTMILAALLTPADFGIVAVSALVIAMAQIIVGLGLGQAVVQRRTMVIEAASFAFWLSLSLAGFLYAALWIASPWIAQIYHIPQLDRCDQGIWHISGSFCVGEHPIGAYAAGAQVSRPLLGQYSAAIGDRNYRSNLSTLRSEVMGVGSRAA